MDLNEDLPLSHDAMLYKLFKDMYFGGNGQKALTVRVAELETGQVHMTEQMGDIKKMIYKGLWLLLGTFAASVSGVLIEIFVKGLSK